MQLPVGTDEDGNELFEEFTTKEMGLHYPMLVEEANVSFEEIPLPESDLEEEDENPEEPNAIPNEFGSGDRDAEEESVKPTTITVERLDFKFQMAWKETLLTERLEALKKKREAAEKAAAAAADANAAQPEQ